MKVYERTENGTKTIVSIEEGLDEIDAAVLGRLSRERTVRKLSHLNRTDIIIEHSDGRTVTLIRIDEPAKVEGEADSEGRPIITVKGKRYIVGGVVPARPKTDDSPTWVPEAFANYWAERDGKIFGPTLHASASRKPGTVGRAIWDAVNR
ncbi:hypothetical protein [Streptomyces lydicus]|uniref:hypothetical protein n=1 Tax=Streptomyces lydicus TaxID=47763 RepID=UPI0036EEDB85